MSEKITIYDIDNPYHLKEDVDAILSEISDLYSIKFNKGGKNEYWSKTVIPKEQSWVGNESKKAFNQLVPKIKSLTTDMYSIIEGVMKSKNGHFKKLVLEHEYENLKHFRVFVNKLKHHNDREAKIILSELVFMGPNGHGIDLMIQFLYQGQVELQLVRFTELVDVFLAIMEKEKVIRIGRI